MEREERAETEAACLHGAFTDLCCAGDHGGDRDGSASGGFHSLRSGQEDSGIYGQYHRGAGQADEEISGTGRTGQQAGKTGDELGIRSEQHI